MNIVPTAECVFVHLSEMDTKLPAAAASRNRKRRTVGNNCSLMRTAVDHMKMVSKACVWHSVTSGSGIYQLLQSNLSNDVHV